MVRHKEHPQQMSANLNQDMAWPLHAFGGRTTVLGEGKREEGIPIGGHLYPGAFVDYLTIAPLQPDASNLTFKAFFPFCPVTFNIILMLPMFFCAVL
jgi:hypothetical protein